MTTQTPDALSPSRSPVGGEAETVADKLRSAFMQVQAAKKRIQEPDLTPIWAIVNMVPAVLYELDHMAEFEREAAGEEVEDAISPALVQTAAQQDCAGPLSAPQCAPVQGDVAGHVQYITAALSRYDGGPASADVKAAWSAILSALAAPPSPSEADVGALEALKPFARLAEEIPALARIRDDEEWFHIKAKYWRAALATFRASHDGGL